MQKMQSDCELKMWFDAFDFTKTGEVSFHDLQHILKLMLVSIHPDELLMIATHLNTNGMFDFEQVRLICDSASVKHEPVKAEALVAALRLISSDGEYIRAVELNHIKGVLAGRSISQPAVDRLFNTPERIEIAACKMTNLK